MSRPSPSHLEYWQEHIGFLLPQPNTMAYLAIARKFRPQRFEEIVGQGHVTRTLQNAIKLQRVHHAFLFTGARGVGKTTAARVLAKALNCEQGPTPSPCNECRACKEITAGIASDVQEIDAASNTGVDNIRDLRDKLRYLPSSGKYRIYIVDEVHMLSAQAFNALLKTLEEPPPHVIFIFATTDPQKVPDTILSRCQRFDFKRIPIKVLSEKLAEIAAAEGIDVTESALLMIAREAEGSMRDAESLLDQVISSCESSVKDKDVVEVLGLFDRRLLFDCISGILERTPEKSLAAVERVYGFGFDVKPFARDLLEVVRHLNVVKVARNAERYVDISAEEFKALTQLAERSTVEELSRYFELLLKGFDEIARSEAPRLTLELALLRMAQVRPVKPMGELLDKLTALESTVRRAGGWQAGPGASSSVQGVGSGSSQARVPPVNAPAGISETRATGHEHARAVPVPPEIGDSKPEGAATDGTRAAAEGEDHRPAPPPPATSRSGSAALPESSQTLSAPGEAQPAPAGTPPTVPTLEVTHPTHGRSTGPGSPDRAPESSEQAPGDDDGGSSQAPDAGEDLVSQEGPSRTWLGFMTEMLARPDLEVRPVFLQEAATIKEEEGRLVLGLSRDPMVRRAKQELSSPTVGRLLQDYYGRSMDVRCVVLKGSTQAGPSYRVWWERQVDAHKQEVAARVFRKPFMDVAQRVLGVTRGDVRIEIEPADG